MSEFYEFTFLNLSVKQDLISRHNDFIIGLAFDVCCDCIDLFVISFSLDLEKCMIFRVFVEMLIARNPFKLLGELRFIS